MDGYRLQLKLFELIRDRMDDSSHWADEISEKLSLSKSAAYKKINASSSLSLEELAILLLEYNLKLDQLIRPDEPNIAFDFPYMSRQIGSFLDYILPLKENVEFFSRLPNVAVQYTTHELPIFYWMLSRDLFYFKMYAFAHTIWEMDGYKNEQFKLDQFSGEQVIMKEANATALRYLDMPSTEYWNQNILNNTLNQIKYFANSGLFANIDDALIICDRLKEVTDHVKQMASVGKKFAPGQEVSDKHVDFVMYHNEIAHTNNTIMVNSETVNAVFATYDSPNFMVSTDPVLVRHTTDWYDRLRKHSLPVTKEASKSRNYLFSRINAMIDRTKSELESLKSSGEAFSI